MSNREMSVRKVRCWSVGGGKGGVGKSSLTAWMSLVLAQKGRSVIVVDADLGSSNLHTYLGRKSPSWTLLDILGNRVPLEEGLQPTPHPNLRLLSCAGDLLGAADCSYERCGEMMAFLDRLPADLIITDLGAGTGSRILDFFNLADEGIVVTSPDPAAMQSCYAFIKGAVYRRIRTRFAEVEPVQTALSLSADADVARRPKTMLEFYEVLCASEPSIAEQVAGEVEAFHPLLVVNLASTAQEQRVAEIIGSACRKFLSVDLRFVGLIPGDHALRRAAQRLEPPDFNDSNLAAGEPIRDVVRRLLNSSRLAAGLAQDEPGPLPLTPVMGINDSLEFLGRKFHIQTEDLGFSGRRLATQVFCDGRVIFSRSSEYPPALQGHASRGAITESMRRQHMDVIRELENRKGRFLRAS